MHNPLVTLLVLNWNGQSIIEECIHSLKKTEYNNIEILVVDNASTDNSLTLLNKIDGIRIVSNQTNLGYAAGNNVGFKHACGKYIATLNNDIVVEPTWLNEAITFLEENNSIGIISCRQMDYYKRDKIDSLYSVPTPFLLLQRGCRGETYLQKDNHSKPGYVIGANGASAIYRKEMLDTIGGFEESFFAYQEENDLQMRCFINGWKCVYVPTALVYHMGSATFNKVKDILYYYHERNRIWYIYRYFPASIIIQNIFTILLREIRTMANIVFLRKRPGIYLKARRDGFSGLFKFTAVRKINIQNFRKRYKEYRLLEKNKIILIENKSTNQIST